MRRHRNIQQSYAGLFNGTTHTFSKTSPTKMDLNGSEMLTNTTFDVDVTGWTGASGITLAQQTVVKRTGAGAASMTSDGTANGVVRLSSGVADVSTNKFTGEVWFYSPAASVGKQVQVSLYRSTSPFTSYGSSGTINLVSDTWTKVVVNGQANGAQSALQIDITYKNPSASDVLYIDDVSLTQAYDGLAVFEFKTSSTGAAQQLLNRWTSSGGFQIRIQADNTLTCFITDGTNIQATGATAVTDGRTHRAYVTFNHTGNMQIYLDGATYGSPVSITTLGKSISSDDMRIGWLSGGFFSGLIGESIYVRYPSLPSDIASWIAYANTQRFIPEPPGGGETVLRVFGRRNDALDQSGNQGLLVNTGGTPIIPK